MNEHGKTTIKSSYRKRIAWPVKQWAQHQELFQQFSSSSDNRASKVTRYYSFNKRRESKKDKDRSTCADIYDPAKALPPCPFFSVPVWVNISYCLATIIPSLWIVSISNLLHMMLKSFKPSLFPIKCFCHIL